MPVPTSHTPRAQRRLDSVLTNAPAFRLLCNLSIKCCCPIPKRILIACSIQPMSLSCTSRRFRIAFRKPLFSILISERLFSRPPPPLPWLAHLAPLLGHQLSVARVAACLRHSRVYLCAISPPTIKSKKKHSLKPCNANRHGIRILPQRVIVMKFKYFLTTRITDNTISLTIRIGSHIFLLPLLAPGL